ncbi:MAG: hypothetical protein HC888_02575 [Candidatus Competibacteraceae bacterium]|nr:hypothetical protein [Candidatus Competibacteraceae bacterium]
MKTRVGLRFDPGDLKFLLEFQQADQIFAKQLPVDEYFEFIDNCNGVIRCGERSMTIKSNEWARVRQHLLDAGKKYVDWASRSY